MEKEFWLGKWERHEIGFHQPEYNPFLVKKWQEFTHKYPMAKTSVFVPLCGKSLDMLFLVEQGYKVIGVELSAIACEEFFSENNIDYTIEKLENFTLYNSENISLYCGDMFNMHTEMLKDVGYVYDRASLIALPHEMRLRYVDFMESNLIGAKVFLVVLDFDNTEVGPPHSITEGMVESYFSNHYKISSIAEVNIPLEKFGKHKDKITQVSNKLYWLS